MEILELQDLSNYLASEPVQKFISVVLIIAISLPVLLVLKRWARNFATNRYAPHYGMLADKVVFYTGLVIILMTVLGELGISLAPLLGAAGIVGVALGFASQTSVSNIISGLFLIAEQPFKVDDVIRINQTTGIVMSIDVLSIKLRTFDNQFVRIPNEAIIKTEVVNLTRFPIRRFTAKVPVAYKEDIGQVREILLDVASKNKHTLSDPVPLVIFENFGDSAIDLSLRVWAPSDEYIHLKNSIQEEIKARFDEEEIEMPLPHISLYAGSKTDAIPVRLSSSDEPKTEDKL